ncbi:L-alanine-DL-glutamate epimerase [Aquipluma nitroreducens]|uniref:Dipeptide epimerase n=1 Tax=Aquipluma nitroreducens TaxID=2010828 RepID=A0A5K7S6H1_9BACT|nr:dipeptide epimerase [Aquipluma nitroreducens]BBE17087.1 L-alanine-DL-glutamate epimerase [Aquipluma nitroreducens]
MLITQIEVYQFPVKLKKPFVISLGSFEYAENVVVVIRTDEGLSGFGECSPFMPINGESMETCYVVANYLAKSLINKDPRNIEACSELMDRTIFGNSSIKSAFDIALYDIAAQQVGLPLYAFLGGKNNKILKTDYTVSLNDPAQMVADALEIKERGFQVIKVKLGDDPGKDIQRIQAIREQIGSDIPLRLDANQGWNVDSAIRVLTELAGYNIQFCEEPIPRWNYMELPRISKASPVMVMADESCCDHHDAQRLIDLDAAPSFNIKLGKSSGIFKAQKIINLAEKANLQLQIGGFLESRIGFTASAHLALTSDNVRFCDFDTPMMFCEDPVSGGIQYGLNGLVTVPETPGLGASIDACYLKGLTSFTVR